MPGSSYFPSKDALLVTWANTFASVLSASPATYNATAPTATAFSALATALSNAYETAMEPATRTRGSISAKNSAKLAMKLEARKIVRAIYANPPSDQALIDIGLRPYDVGPTPVPAPAAAPAVSVVSVYGRNVTIRIKDASGERRGKPEGCVGAALYSFVGPTAPLGNDGWKSEGNITRATVIVEFPETVAPGSKVWFTAAWFNPRGLTGPACTPIASATGYEGASPLAA
jgi:hypothetical protein